jgi:hypothetical protein
VLEDIVCGKKPNTLFPAVINNNPSNGKQYGCQIHIRENEQLRLFAEWLEYNGKCMPPAKQVKQFIKEHNQK